MGEKKSENSREGADLRHAGATMTAPGVEDWFVREVLPLEAMLMRYLQQNWRNKSDIEDFRQEVYAQVLEAAETSIPERTRAFVLTTARNLLINRMRREQVVRIDAVPDPDALGLVLDEPGIERNVIARDLLRRLQTALESLPPRCREAVILRRIEGVPRAEIARRMGIAERTVADHIAAGMCALADVLYGEGEP